MPNTKDFDYLSPDVLYFDSACQTLRPQQVIDAERSYYQEFNACGHRVKYEWGEKVDAASDQARAKLLKLLKKSEKEYTVAFTLNTTYGINLVLHQLPNVFSQIVVSEIEHNSVFLPSITWAKQRNLPRHVLSRNQDGGLEYKPEHLEKSVVLLNATSNIDGRELQNAPQLAKDVHTHGGVLLLDAAQAFAHSLDLLQTTDFDAAFGSAHKMYAPSLGFIVIKKSLLQRLNYFFLGGGTVSDVSQDSFTLITDEHEDYAPLELGLQNWAGLVGVNAMLDWLPHFQPEGAKAALHEKQLAEKLFQGLREIPAVQLLNTSPSSVIALYTEKVDAHRLAAFLGEQKIMCRSGYFCCHYYLQHVKKLPPLLRVSLGLHNTAAQVDAFLNIFRTLLQNL